MEKKVTRPGNGMLYGAIAEFNPKTKKSPFGAKGWEEVVRYYNEYKTNTVQK